MLHSFPDAALYVLAGPFVVLVVISALGRASGMRSWRATNGGGSAKMDREAVLRLELFVEDMAASIDFYTQVLAFEVVRHEPDDYTSLSWGNAVLGIGPVAKLPEDGGYFGRDISSYCRGLGVEIVLEVDDVDEWHTRVGASGHPILESLHDRPWGLRDFRIADPDSYYLRITSGPADGQQATFGEHAFM
jgi:lactoylglutathione lyase